MMKIPYLVCMILCVCGVVLGQWRLEEDGRSAYRYNVEEDSEAEANDDVLADRSGRTGNQERRYDRNRSDSLPTRADDDVADRDGGKRSGNMERRYNRNKSFNQGQEQ